MTEVNVLKYARKNIKFKNLSPFKYLFADLQVLPALVIVLLTWYYLLVL